MGTAALAIFAVCAGFVILRGITRMIVGTVVLGISAWIGFRIWQQAPDWSISWMGKPMPWLTNGLPLMAFLVSFFVIHKIVKTVTSPFGKNADGNRSHSLIHTAFRLFFALVPTSLIWLIGATVIHHGGSIAEVRSYAEKSHGNKKSEPETFSQRLKSSIETALPASWLKALDPLADPSRIALAKLITSKANAPQNPVIDPHTGKPIPRAIIVEDQDLQNLAREGKFDTLLRHPLLTKALADPKIQQQLRDFHL